jgi:hypothetical protein
VTAMRKRPWTVTMALVIFLLLLSLGTRLRVADGSRSTPPAPHRSSSAHALAEPQLHVSPSGSDTSCARAGAPCRTWDRAYQLAQAGDTIEVAGGTYPEVVLRGTKAVTFRVAPKQTVTLTDGLEGDSLQNVTFFGPVNTGGYDAGIYTKGCSANLEFHQFFGKKFAITESSRDIKLYGGDWGGYQTGGSDSSVAGYTGDGSPSCGDGIVRNILIDGVRFHDVLYEPSSQWNGAHPDCFETYGKVNGVTIRNSVFERCGNTYIGFYTDFGDFSNVLIENNLFRGGVFDSYWSTQIMQKTGFKCGVVFRYNTYDSPGNSPSPPRIDCASAEIYGNIFRVGPPSWECHGNWSYNVFESKSQSGDNCGTNSITVKNAFFVDRGPDYHLRPGSPAIGRGDPKRFPAQDVDGQSRSSGHSPDAGFDQTQGIPSDEARKVLTQAAGELESSAGAVLLAGNAVCADSASRTGTTPSSAVARGSFAIGGRRVRTGGCVFVTAAVASWTQRVARGLTEIAKASNDSNFRSVAVPAAERMPLLKSTDPRTNALVQQLNTESKRIGSIVGYLAAAATSFARAEGAGAALDASWQDRQLAAAREDARLAAAAISGEVSSRANVKRALTTAGLPARGLSTSEASSVARTKGARLPRGIATSLVALGLRPAEVAELANHTKALQLRDLTGLSAPTSLIRKDAISRLRAVAATLTAESHRGIN